jgi:hypothetical protein
MDLERMGAWLVLIVAGWLVWFAGTWLLARVSGWHTLARAYRSPEPAPRPSQRNVRIVFSVLAPLQHGVHVHQTPAALLLTPLLLLRPTHPPLAIPWQAITSRRPGRMLGAAVIELRTAAAPETPFVLPATVLADMHDRLPPATPGDISLPPGWGKILVTLLLLAVSLLFGIVWFQLVGV